MPKEATLLIVLLLGLVTVVSPTPTEHPVITTEHTAIVEMVSNGATASDHLKRLKRICHESGVVEASYCLAFKQLQSHLGKNIIQEIDLLGQEQPKKVTATEDICSNLTELVKHLPSEWRSKELKSFAQDERCISVCSKTNGSEDDIQSDDCWLLFVGFQALIASHPERERIEQVQPKMNKEKLYDSEKPLGGVSETTQNIPIEENTTRKTKYVQAEQRALVKKSRTYDPNDFNNQNYYLYFLFSFAVLGTLYGIYRCTDDTKKV
ncbi:AGAP013053-PA-like protein [Anopheles sinensis]|uniref:AGAP013053-PA-like protein n=1 Tax=Anopheles sinensis TaxID=74873 RepID=A0A084WT63_ANOSI|nr:AGAP013053-PA-like protein [Anopheles sinensis]